MATTPRPGAGVEREGVSPEPSQQFVRHTLRPEWGVGVLVSKTGDSRIYLFADGERRSIKEAFCQRLIEAAPAPESAEARERLSRGLTAGGKATPRAIHLELEEEILRRPDDAGTYLVYADWLQARGDPRGELITVQHQLAQAPDSRALRQAEATLLGGHGEYLVPPLLAGMLAQPRRKTDPEGSRSEVTWRLGFFDAVRVARRSPQQPEVPAVVAELLRHPSAHFLRGLTIGPLGKLDEYDYRPTVEALAAAAPRRLEELILADFTAEHVALPFSTLGEVSALLRALPALRRLTLRGGSLRFETALEHPGLRVLTVTTAELAVRTAGRLCRACLPELERLELDCPSLKLPERDLAVLLTAKDLPKLRWLSLRQTLGTAGPLQALLESGLLAQLDGLDLSEGDLTDSSVDLLLRHAEGLKRLKVLDLSANRLSPAAAARLASLCAEVKAQPRLLRNPVTEAQVIASAPDARSATSARSIAHVGDWLLLFRDGDRVWGEYEGSDHYEVFADMGTLRAGCTCPSPKDPCKHALALLLIAASQHEFAERPMPDGLVARSQSRPRYDPVWE